MHFFYEFRGHPSWTVSRGLRIFVKHFGTCVLLLQACSFDIDCKTDEKITLLFKRRQQTCIVTIFRLANTSLYQVYEEKARISRNIYAVKASKTMNGSCINGELVGWGYSEKSG